MKFKLIILILTLNITFTNEVIGAKIKQTEFSIKPEIVFDSNIFENSDNVKASENKQIWLSLNRKIQSGSNLSKIFWTANYSHYHNLREENKFFTNINLFDLRPFSNSIFLSSSGNFFWKYWNNIYHGYYNVNLTENIGIKTGRFTSQVGYIYKAANFIEYDNFDNFSNGLNLSIFYNLDRHKSFHCKLLFYKSKFPRSYYDNKLRSDNTTSLKIGGEYKKKVIAGINLSLSLQNSNIDYFEFFNTSLHCYGSLKISKLYVQLILYYQLKKYLNNFHNGDIVYNPDPEQNIQNQIFLGLEYPVTKAFSINSKAAFIKSETSHITQYYTKQIFVLGVQYKF